MEWSFYPFTLSQGLDPALIVTSVIAVMHPIAVLVANDAAGMMLTGRVIAVRTSPDNTDDQSYQHLFLRLSK